MGMRIMMEMASQMTRMMMMTAMASLMEMRTTTAMALRTTKIPTTMEMAFLMSMTSCKWFKFSRNIYVVVVYSFSTICFGDSGHLLLFIHSFIYKLFLVEQ